MQVRNLQNLAESMDKIEDIADALRTVCKRMLDELVTCSKTIRHE